MVFAKLTTLGTVTRTILVAVTAFFTGRTLVTITTLVTGTTLIIKVTSLVPVLTLFAFITHHK